MKTKLLNKFFIFSLIIFNLICCSKKKNDDFNKNIIKVKVYNVKEQNLIPEIKTIGTISFKKKVDILPKTSGRIENLYVKEGDKIYKGQLLATLEQFQLLLELKQAASELDAAKSNLELTKAKYKDSLQNVERQFLTIEKAKAELEDKKATLDNINTTLLNNERLLKEGAVSEESIRNLKTQYHTYYTQHMIAERDLLIQEIGYRDKDITENGFKVPDKQEEKIKILKDLNTQIMSKEVEVAESNVKIAQTKVDSVNAYLNETYIRSPINGIVAAKYLEIGEEAKTDSKIFTVMDTFQVYAKINVSESDLVRVKPNGEVVISVDALSKKEYQGKIELISPIIDAKTRTVEISAIISNPDNSLIPGMFVRANIKSNESRKTIFIPPGALISVEKDKADVFVIKKDIAFRKSIRLGPEEENMIEVYDGLKNGDLIVNDPPIDLIEGSKVEVQNE